MIPVKLCFNSKPSGSTQYLCSLKVEDTAFCKHEGLNQDQAIVACFRDWLSSTHKQMLDVGIDTLEGIRQYLRDNKIMFSEHMTPRRWVITLR